jgi:hypothetical protein
MCDKAALARFDYSRLSPEFSKLPKPAQRALLNNRIYTPGELALRTLGDVLEFHGIGPSAIPILRRVLRKHGLSFRKAR